MTIYAHPKSRKLAHFFLDPPSYRAIFSNALLHQHYPPTAQTYYYQLYQNSSGLAHHCLISFQSMIFLPVPHSASLPTVESHLFLPFSVTPLSYSPNNFQEAQTRHLLACSDNPHITSTQCHSSHIAQSICFLHSAIAHTIYFFQISAYFHGSFAVFMLQNL